MTFDEYNTDENFKGNSTANELVRLGKAEGKTRDEIANSLSPLWKEDKKGNVKKALDYHFNTEAPKNNTVISTRKGDQEFLENQNAIMNAAEDAEVKRQNEAREQRYAASAEAMRKQGEAFRKINDHFTESLPTFITRRYQNGEFGDLSTPEGKKDAKLRMAYFMINGVGTALGNVSNVIKGRELEKSDYEKYKESNMAQGLENRWNKNKQEMQAAIDLAKKQGMDEQELQTAIAKISANNRLNSAMNMLNESQKVYALRVMSKIGNEIGNMNDTDFVNTLIGYATSGDSLNWQEAAEILIGRYGKDVFSKLKPGANNGDYKDITAGASGNLKNYQTIDGETIDFNIIETKEGKEKLRKLMDDLSQRYYDGEIDADTFRKYYDPLYEESRRHMGTGSRDSNAMIKANNATRLNELEETFKKLNSDASKGIISIDDYKEQYDNLVANAKKWGANEKMLASFTKNKKSDEVLKKAIAKAASKKK